MQLLHLAIFALVGLVAVKAASNPPLWKTWHDGAALVAAPVTELYVDGENLRNETILSFDKYLIALNTELDRQYAWGVNEILQPCGLRFREIIDMQVLVTAGIATPDQFDYQLWYLTRAFDSVVQMVRQGEGLVRQAPRLRTEELFKSLRDHVPSAAEISPYYTNSQLFYSFESDVLTRDFNILRNWLLSTFEAGVAAVMGAASEMEENYRQTYMWPMVKSLQQDSTTVSQYDESVQQHSAASYWTEYVRARSELLTL